MRPLNRALKNLSYLGFSIRDPVKSNLRRVIKWIYIAMASFIITPQVTYVYVNRANIKKCTNVFLNVSSAIQTVLKLLILIINENDIRKLVNEIISMKLMDTYKIGDPVKIESNYLNIEKQLDKLSKMYEYLFIFATTSYMVKPACFQVYAYLTNSVTNETYLTPFDDIYVYDTSQSPIYEITYLIACLSTTANLVAFVTMAQLYFGISMYIIGMYNQLELMLTDLDADYGHQVESKLNRIIKCAKFHEIIMCFVRQTDKLYSKSIFIQYCCSLLALIGIICESIKIVSNIQLFLNIVLIVCIMSDLLLCCWTGSMVSDERCNLNKFIYSISWYNYTTSEKKLLQIMMVRTQSECGYLALGYFSCNVETFSKILSHAFSVFAVIRNVT